MPSPSASHNQLIAAACRQIEASDGLPELGELAAQAGLSPWHFHRVFKAATGLTPRSYANARRAEKVREQLLQGKSVTETLYASGFNSSGRFYEAANGMLGMSPTAFRAGGSKASIHFALAQCSLGAVLVACSERGVCAILLGDEPQALLDDLQRRFPKPHWSEATRTSKRSWPRCWASSRRRARGWTCPWTSAAPRSSNGYGRRWRGSNLGPRPVTPKSRRASARRTRCAPWPGPVQRTPWP